MWIFVVKTFSNTSPSSADNFLDSVLVAALDDATVINIFHSSITGIKYSVPKERAKYAICHALARMCSMGSITSTHLGD